MNRENIKTHDRFCNLTITERCKKQTIVQGYPFLFSEYKFSFLLPNLGKAAEKKDTNEPVKKSKTIFHPHYFKPKQQITLEPNGIVVSEADGSATGIEILSKE